MKSALPIIMVAILVSALASARLEAATSSRSIGVSATVLESCSAAASPISHGTVTGSSVIAFSTLSVNCTYSTPYSVGLSYERAPGTTIATRNRSGSALLGYSLRGSMGAVVAWGRPERARTVAEVGNSSVQAVSILGQAPASSEVDSGPAADMVVLTVTY